jgi:hypothetical protein
LKERERLLLHKRYFEELEAFKTFSNNSLHNYLEGNSQLHNK